MANILSREKRITVLGLLVEGMSLRSILRVTGVNVETTLALLLRVGTGCAILLDSLMRDLKLTNIECDEIWGFIHTKQRHLKPNDPATWGDAWTWVAIDTPTKLIPTWRVGKREGLDADAFIADLHSRLRNNVQINTDGLSAYVDAIEKAAGADATYARVIKEYEAETVGPGRYSPPKVKSVEKTAIFGSPDMDLAGTSFVERQNLTMRMAIRRMTRLTNAFSKKLPNHKAATALHFAHYNLCRKHQTLRVTPAMEAGVVPTMWSMGELLDAALAMQESA